MLHAMSWTLRRREAAVQPSPTAGARLPGRDELEQHLGELMPEGRILTLAVVKVHGLGAFTVIHGQHRTEELLAAVEAALRDMDDVPAFRVDEGRFALVFTEPSDIAADRATPLKQLPWRSTACIGLASARAEEGALSLIDRATRAMLEAHRRGAGSLVQFHSGTDEVEPVTPARAKALLDLLSSGEIRIHYQPILGIEQRQVLGFEAFARPQATHDLNGPIDAFDVAERLGLTPELDAMCRSSIFADGPGFHMPPATRLHVNLAPMALGHRSLSARELHRQVRDAGLKAAQVVFELREHPGVPMEVLAGELTSLRRLGFGLALDDIGASSGGLVALQVGCFDLLKLAPSVTARIGEDRRADAVLDAIAAYAHHTDAQIIATGVETAQQFVAVRDFRDRAGTRAVHAAQGYHLGAPAPQPTAHRNRRGEDAATRS